MSPPDSPQHEPRSKKLAFSGNPATCTWMNFVLKFESSHLKDYQLSVLNGETPPPNEDTSDEDRARYHKTNKEIFGALINVLFDPALTAVAKHRHTQDGVGAYATLTNLYQQLDFAIAETYAVKLRALETPVTDIKDMLKRIDEILLLQGKILSCGETCPDKQVYTTILRAIPKSWRQWRATALRMPMSLDTLIANIRNLAHEEQLSEELEGIAPLDGQPTSGTELAESAFNVTFQCRKQELYCLNCRRPGHLERDCWGRAKGTRRGAPDDDYQCRNCRARHHPSAPCDKRPRYDPGPRGNHGRGRGRPGHQPRQRARCKQRQRP